MGERRGKRSDAMEPNLEREEMGHPMAHAGEDDRRRGSMEKVEELETLEMGMESSFLSEESDKLTKDRERRRRVSVSAIKGFLESGNSVVIMLGEGGEGKYGTNINYLLEEYGMAVNPDCARGTVGNAD
ncbi:hypothetical protein T484DRAFT_1792526 [Baffinella frigidus]|nr:hypothetical protein T484DRAFT_1792526 [Cryptophyta sp. CCMP2293]